MPTTKVPLPNTTYALVPLTTSDIPQSSEFLCASKLQLTINRLLWHNWPAFEVQKKHYSKSVEGAIASSSSESGGIESSAVTEGWKVVTCADENVVVGHLFLTRMAGGANDAIASAGDMGTERNQQEVPDGLVPEVFNMVNETVQKLNAQSKLQGIEHIELTHIWIDPLHRNRGIGTALIGFCKRKCKEAGNLPFYTQSEPQLQPYLMTSKKNFGFVDDGHADMELARFAPAYSGFGPFRLFGLRWDPKPTP